MAGADGVEPDAALEACAGAPPQFALHLVLGDKLGGADRNMQEAVDLPVADRGMHCAEGGPFGLATRKVSAMALTDGLITG